MRAYTFDRFVIALLIAIVVVFAVLLPRLAMAQTIAADAYPADGTQPDVCTCAAANAPALTCALAPVSAGVEPRCSVAAITTAGTYSLTITVTRKEKITNTSGGGTFVPAASATSAPFAYTRGGAALPPPTGAALTTQ